MVAQLDLAKYTMPELLQMERNAKALAVAGADTERGVAAEKRLGEIEDERARRSLPGNIVSFMQRFPKGFYDQAFLDAERTDKVQVSNLCQKLLSHEAIQSGNLQGLVRDVKRVVNASNLIQGGFEKPKLLQKVEQSDVSPEFFRQLDALMHGSGEAPDRLEVFSDYMHTLGLRKWTYGTYFLFLSDPGNCTFVKPENLKKAIEIVGYPVDYDSAPSAQVYRQILGFYQWVKARLKAEQREELVPRDMIDIQSFIWTLAPTGKFARS